MECGGKRNATPLSILEFVAAWISNNPTQSAVAASLCRCTQNARSSLASAAGSELPRLSLAFDDHERNVVGGLRTLGEFS